MFFVFMQNTLCFNQFWYWIIFFHSNLLFLASFQNLDLVEPNQKKVFTTDSDGKKVKAKKNIQQKKQVYTLYNYKKNQPIVTISQIQLNYKSITVYHILPLKSIACDLYMILLNVNVDNLYRII